ncbi:hypothetical protein EYR36_009968 [Pleurotus pulmonarius]|nr:hypothetical protein EYR36_009968 [Pleurotus pulmonarius]KAF4593446.1 hypothetical protein EYR38_009160 [Pleurotus pulmonarius]
MFRLRPAVFTPPPSPAPSPPPRPRLHIPLYSQSTQADEELQYSTRELVAIALHPNAVPAPCEQQGASVLTAPRPPTTQPMLALTTAPTNTHTHASFQHTSTAQNPIAVHPTLSGPGVPPANDTMLQRSPPSVRTRIHDRARQCASATGCTDRDADEDTRTGTGDGTALSVGAGLREMREMWAEQEGRTLAGPGVPPSPPRLSRRAKGKWRETERSPPPSPTGPAADMLLRRFCTLATIDKEGDQDTRDDGETDDENDAKKRKKVRQEAYREENGLLTRAQLDAMVPHLPPHLGLENPEALAAPPHLSQKDIDAAFQSLTAGLKAYYGALEHDPRPLEKESSDFGGNDKGPMTRSKSRRYANIGATDGATEVQKEEKKEVGRSKQGTKRKRTADDDKGVATTAATATTSGRGKAKKPTKTKSAETDTNGATKTNAKTHQDASEAPEDTDSPRPTKRARLTVPRTPAKARVQAKLVIRLPPRTRAELRARDTASTSAIKRSLNENENEGEAIQETDKDGENGELHAGFEVPCQELTFGLADESSGPLAASAKSNNDGDVSKVTSDKNDENISTATRSDINQGESISAQGKWRRTRKNSKL